MSGQENRPQSEGQDDETLVMDEPFIVAKTGHAADCEDAVQVLPLAAVIDGSTSKTGSKWAGKTGGQICADLVRQVLGEQASLQADARQVVERMTQRVHEFYHQNNLLQTVRHVPEYRSTASFVAYHSLRREIWMVGDCQCLIDGQQITNRKHVDELLSETRALFLESELAQGRTVEELCREDRGREFILPLLKRQMIFQNNPAAGPFWYAVIDGFPVPDEGIKVIPVPPGTREIVLASDGYPLLKPTLEESEAALAELLRVDPLLFRTYLSTKGINAGDVSFDDRAYVRLRFTPGPVLHVDR